MLRLESFARRPNLFTRRTMLSLSSLMFGPGPMTKSSGLDVESASQARASTESERGLAQPGFVDFASHADAAGSTIPSEKLFLRTAGYTEPGDNGGALYKKADSEPTHGGKLQSTDGAWWELAERVVSPEMFGAVGDGVADDDAKITGLTAYGRARGALHLVGKPGAVYNLKSAYTFSGIKRLRLQHLKFRNTLGTSVDTTFASNLDGLSLGTIFGTNGASDYAGEAYTGELIATVAAGSSTIVATGDITKVREGDPIFIYGFSRGGTGFPPDPAVFEYNEVESILDSTITLRHRLKFSYDSRWLDIAGTFAYGAPRVISGSRDNFTQCEFLEIDDVEIVRNPNWTSSAANEERNGRITIGGYKYARLARIKTAGGLYITQGEMCELDCSDQSTSIEFDKCIDTAYVRKPSLSRLQGGNGVRNLLVEDGQGDTFHSLAPIDTLKFVRGMLTDTSGSSSTALIGAGASLTRIVEYQATRFHILNARRTSVTSNRFTTFVIGTVVSDTLFTMTRTAFLSAQAGSFSAERCMFYDLTGNPAFQLNRMPYEISGTIYFEGQALKTLTGGDSLVAPAIEKLRIIDPILSGDYADGITTISLPTNSPCVTDIESFDMGRDWFRTDYKKFPLVGGARLHCPGKLFICNRVTVHVVKPYTGSTRTATLQLRKLGGPTIFTVDLKNPGRRVFDLGGNYGLVQGDSGAIIDIPIDVFDARVTSPLDVTGGTSQAPVWSLYAEGMRP